MIDKFVMVTKLESEKKRKELRMKQKCLLVVLVCVLYTCALARNGIIVGWSPIKNVKDPHVTEIANFAVTEYDKRSGEKLKLEKVMKGESQVVEGLNYRLTLTATSTATASDGSSSNTYQAVVWEKLWEHYRNLTSFTLLHT